MKSLLLLKSNQPSTILSGLSRARKHFKHPLMIKPATMIQSTINTYISINSMKESMQQYSKSYMIFCPLTNLEGLDFARAPYKNLIDSGTRK